MALQRGWGYSGVRDGEGGLRRTQLRSVSGGQEKKVDARIEARPLNLSGDTEGRAVRVRTERLVEG